MVPTVYDRIRPYAVAYTLKTLQVALQSALQDTLQVALQLPLSGRLVIMFSNVFCSHFFTLSKKSDSVYVK